MEACKPILNTGLRGFAVATTRISDVDGAAGKLIYRGYLIAELAERASFEEIVHLLLFEKLPDQNQLADIQQRLNQERALPAEVIEALQTRPADALPMDVLQAAAAMLANHDPDVLGRSAEGSQRMALRLVAKFPTIVAAWERIRNGLAPVPPAGDLGHAANFLYMLSGKRPDAETAHFMDTAMVLHAEHAFNASTFAAREVASTRAHMYAAIAAAVGSLSGELHGGANVRVMEMLQKIGSVDAVADYVNGEFDAGRVIFGLGHAVYQTDDPRAHILAPMAKTLGEGSGQPQWYEISRKVEQTAKASFRERKGRDIYVNVDFYSAALYYAMGIPLDLFTPVFAVARVAGWAAHVIEEQFGGAAPKPVLYRPDSEYVGDYCGPEECTFEPIESR